MVGKILNFVDYVAVFEFHDAERAARPSQVNAIMFPAIHESSDPKSLLISTPAGLPE